MTRDPLISPLSTLVASPSAFCVKTVGDILQDQGVRSLRSVGHGRDLMKALMESVPGLMVVDDTLPGLTGAEMLRILKADTAVTALPVAVLLVELPTKTIVEEARVAGFSAVISKPIASGRFLSGLRFALRSRRAAA